MTTNKIDLFSSKWCDLVFDQRNKLYGAYELRKEYAKNIALAIFLAISFSIVSLSIPFVMNLIGETESKPDIPVLPVDLTDLVQPPIVVPPVSKPPQKPSGPSKPTIEFKPPVVQPDNTITSTDLPPVDFDKDAGLVTTLDTNPGNDKTILHDEVVVSKNNEDKPILIANEPPQFPGGDEAMYKYFQKINYPRLAIENGIFGPVYVNFVIGKDGKIREAKVFRGIGFGCDQEALRVINNMPAWKPGKHNGEPVSVLLTLPVSFKLKN